MKKARKIAEFEQAHGGLRIKSLEHRLAVEKAKVEALSDVQNKVMFEQTAGCHLKLAIIGDRHTGSLYQHYAALHAFYEYAEKAGCRRVYDAGDILAGHKVYKGQEFELRDHGLDAQVERLSKDAPRNIPTYFITGNHDASFKNLAGVAVGKVIEQAVSGYYFLGEEQARVEFGTPNGSFVLQLLHPGGGSAYALSYKPQKIVDALGGGTKPNLLAIGHFHKAELMPSYRNVAVVQVGTFEKQTPFMARQGLAAHVGGWIIEAEVGKGWNRIKGEFVAVYV